jgi:hypothetical protein
MIRLPQTLLGFALLLGMAGCVSFNSPGDLTLTSVQAVDSFDQPELPFRSISSLEQAKFTNAQRLYLKVTFTSGKDYRQFSGGWWETTIGMTADLCDSSELYASTSPWVYSGGKQLGFIEPRPAPDSTPDGHGFSYQVFIGANSVPGEISPGKPYFAGYDLLDHPQDVCFWIRGGTMAGSAYRSNIVRIPADVIKSALRDIPPQLAE